MRLPTDTAVSALVRLYTAGEAHLQALVTQALGSGALGTARYRQQRLTEVHAVLADLQGQAVPEATQLVVDAYHLGGNIAGLTGTFGSMIHQDAVELLADNLTGRLNDAATTVGRRVDDVFRREGLRQTALGLITGGTRKQASAQLQHALQQQGVKAFRDNAGREWGLSSYAAMAIRTTTRETVSTATHNTMVEQGTDLVTISHHRGVEPDDTACQHLDGKTFSITGNTPGYEVLPLAQWPPMGTHPNCVHVATPAAANINTLERDLGLTAAVV